VIITACREHEVSFVGNGDLTLFGQALVDGLQGGGDYMANRNGFISVFDLYSHLYNMLQTWVPQRVDAAVRAKYGNIQEPELTVLKGVGPFAVALYRGATTLGGFSAPERPEVDAGLREVDEARSQRLLDQILQVGGNLGDTAGGDIQKASGDIVSGQKAGGDAAGRDIVKPGSDAITVGDISGSSGIAIGRGARATVGGAPLNDELAARFAAISQQIAASDKHAAIKETVSQQVQAVAAEAAKGEQADTGKIEGWLQVIASMMPDILEVTANTLLSPISGVATVVKKVAEKAKATAGRG
jgi:hypothetical protein